MKQSTVIDTVAMQINFNNKIDCNTAYNDIFELLEESGCYYNKEEDVFQYKYKTIATLAKGSYGETSKDKRNSRTVHFLFIKLAGLKRYIHDIDRFSHNCLMRIVSYLNTNKLPVKVTQFDVALDIFTKFKNVLVLCTKRNSTTKYFKANDEEQPFITTTYIERFKSKQHKKDAVLHTCYYCKTSKHKLPFNLSRCEISFQKKFIDNNGLNIGKIYHEFQRYHIMYIPNKKIQQQLKDKYDTKDTLRQKDLKELNIQRYRLTIDINPVVDFVSKLYSVNDTTLNSFLLK